MAKPDDPAIEAQLRRLIDLYEKGVLLKEDFQAALIGMGKGVAEIAEILNQLEQRKNHQTSVVGDVGGPLLSGGFNGPVSAGGGDAVDLRESQGAMYKPRIQITPATEVDPDFLREAYLNRFVRQIYRLQLAGVDPKAATGEGSRELELSAVYTALMTQRTETEGEFRNLKVGGRPKDTSRRLSALAVLNKEPRIALLGDPGSGKSTFVNFVGLCLAGEALGEKAVNLTLLTAPLPDQEAEDFFEEQKELQPQPWEHGFILPVRIVLRDFAARGLPAKGQPADGATLWNFIVAELGEILKEYAPYLKKTLLEEGGLILLDGLDEVPDADQRRVQVKQAVQGFADGFRRCRFLITSRTYAYQRQDWKLEGFAEAVLNPFSPAQIERFVERWYDHVAVIRNLDPEDARGRATLLKTAIDSSLRLAELASRPLLLTLMASLHAWRGGSLPEKREELYRDAVDLLLDQWESPKVVRDAEGQPLVRQPSLAEWLKVDRELVRTELNRLAFEAHQDQTELLGTADIPLERLVTALMSVARNPEVKPGRLIEHLRDRLGLLTARGEGIYTFPHRTFQEYLAACYLTDFGFPDEPAELLKTEPQRWREVVLLAGAKAARGTTSAAWSLAEALCFREPPNEALENIPEADCWGALLAAQTLLENERERLDRVADRNAPKLEKIRLWLLTIIKNGLLPPLDRALAGEALAVFGDDRDFDELVTIPAGPFLLGDDDDTYASPRHEVMLTDFKIGRYPVTNSQYRQFVEATKREWDWEDGRRADWANCPAVVVTWHDARAYCAWLTGIWRHEGKIGADEEVRLSTEAEWEKAARGTDSRVFPWGDKWDETRCNTSESGIGRTCAVGMYPDGAGLYGCLDMAGNVWEWTSSLWGKDYRDPDFKYPYDPADGRENVEADDEILRVLRGGSWSDGQRYARCAYRGWSIPDVRFYSLGFRVVVSPISAL